MTAAQSQIPIPKPNYTAVSAWLSLCMVMIALMVIVGGLTRLTESGLSIVEWKPISGIFPPASDAEWDKEFAGYKATPQFNKSFPDMDVTGFKHIYWLEYAHRLLGRVAGAVFLLPLLWFALRRTLNARQSLKLAAIFGLGFAQGLVGWFMVRSGLMNEPHVSPVLLAFHLATGFTLFALILWQALSFSTSYESTGDFELPHPPLVLKLFSCLVVTLIFLQVILGAGVAGLHAGLTYNTFPLMDGQWVPEGLWPSGTWYKDLFADVTTVQFCHRLMAYSLTLVIPLFWMIGRNNPHVAHLLPILFSILVVQFLLGVLALLFVVPVPLASLHQANALLLFGIAVTILHRLFIPLRNITYEIGGKSALA
jgi:cytochrome c oxidase assembly protein subunit 15